MALSTMREKLTLKEWHKLLGHQNKRHVLEQLWKNNIDFINEDFKCEDCSMGKAHREPFKSSRNSTAACGEIVHADTSGGIADNMKGYRVFDEEKSEVITVRNIMSTSKNTSIQ